MISAIVGALAFAQGPDPNYSQFSCEHAPKLTIDSALSFCANAVNSPKALPGLPQVEGDQGSPFVGCPMHVIEMPVAGWHSVALEKALDAWVKAILDANEPEGRPTRFAVIGYDDHEPWVVEDLTKAIEELKGHSPFNRVDPERSIEGYLRYGRALARAELVALHLQQLGTEAWMAGVRTCHPRVPGAIVYAIPAAPRIVTPEPPPLRIFDSPLPTAIQLPSPSAQLDSLPMDAATSVETASLTVVGLTGGATDTGGQGVIGVSLNPIHALRSLRRDEPPADGGVRAGSNRPREPGGVGGISPVPLAAQDPQQSQEPPTKQPCDAPGRRGPTSRLLDVSLLYPMVADTEIASLPPWVGMRARVDLLGGLGRCNEGWAELLNEGPHETMRTSLQDLLSAAYALAPYAGELSLLEECRAAAADAVRAKPGAARQIASCKEKLLQVKSGSLQEGDTSVARFNRELIQQWQRKLSSISVEGWVEGVEALRKQEGRYLGLDLRGNYFLDERVAPFEGHVLGSAGVATGKNLRLAGRFHAGAGRIPGETGVPTRDVTAAAAVGILMRRENDFSYAKADVGVELHYAEETLSGQLIANTRARWGHLAFISLTGGYDPIGASEEWFLRLSYDFVRPDLLRSLGGSASSFP